MDKMVKANKESVDFGDANTFKDLLDKAEGRKTSLRTNGKANKDSVNLVITLIIKSATKI